MDDSGYSHLGMYYVVLCGAECRGTAVGDGLEDGPARIECQRFEAQNSCHRRPSRTVAENFPRGLFHDLQKEHPVLRNRP